jgi:hypothetical protein
MSLFLRPTPWLLGLAAVAAAGPAALAQQNAPHVGYVFPAGGRQGTTFPVQVGGQFLDGASRVFVSGGGVTAKVVEHDKPLTPLQINALREKAQELRKKNDPASLRELLQLRDKIVAAVARRTANPAISETVTVRVTLAPGAEPGNRELRLTATGGLTNPLVFRVSQLPEFVRQAAPVPPPARPALTKTAQPPRASVQPPTDITFPAVVNGRILPGGVDRYRFYAHKGQKLMIVASARDLIPYLPDAVPGWFQATLAVYDPKGHELAYDDDYRFHPDPVIYFEVPADSQYVIEIKDAVYRGREDFVYRLELGELPFITGIFPLGGTAGRQTDVELTGWNLPASRLTAATRDTPPGIVPLSVTRDGHASNVVPFAVDVLPDCLEQEPNDQPDRAQTLALPIIVNGRVDRPGDRDVFRIDGHAGDEVVAEVVARRLDSPLDSVLELTDATGRRLARNDDHEDKGSGLETHHADSLIGATLPADGTYYLHLTDAQQKGGPEYAYRLRVSAPRPDFALRVVPSSVTVRGNAAAPITVYALRQDGFTGPIALTLKNPPEGVRLGGGLVPASLGQVRVTLTAPQQPEGESIRIELQGRATIQGEEVTRPAVPADDMMQAFAYRHLVPAREMRLAFVPRGFGKNMLRLAPGTPLKIPAGGTAKVPIVPLPNPATVKYQFELSEPPEGITVQSFSITAQGTEVVIACDAKVKPGVSGNLILHLYAQRLQEPAKKKAQAARRPPPTAILPAFPFQVVAGPRPEG